MLHNTSPMKHSGKRPKLRPSFTFGSFHHDGKPTDVTELRTLDSHDEMATL